MVCTKRQLHRHMPGCRHELTAYPVSFFFFFKNKQRLSLFRFQGYITHHFLSVKIVIREASTNIPDRAFMIIKSHQQWGKEDHPEPNASANTK